MKCLEIDGRMPVAAFLPVLNILCDEPSLMTVLE